MNCEEVDQINLAVCIIGAVCAIHAVLEIEGGQFERHEDATFELAENGDAIDVDISAYSCPVVAEGEGVECKWEL